MARVGKIGEFVEGNEDFICYVERVGLYFVANEIRDEKKVAVFLSLIGHQPYALLRNILTPAIPSSKSYAEIVEALKGHYMPKPLIIGERYTFHNRSQKEGEKVTEYIVGLKKLAVTCEFGEFLPQALRDRLVCGLQSVVIQKKLLSVRELTLEKACEISLAMEMADKNTTEMQPSSSTVHKVMEASKGRNQQTYDMRRQTASTTGPVKPCFRCGGKHNASLRTRRVMRVQRLDTLPKCACQRKI